MQAYSVNELPSFWKCNVEILSLSHKNNETGNLKLENLQNSRLDKWKLETLKVRHS